MSIRSKEFITGIDTSVEGARKVLKTNLLNILSIHKWVAFCRKLGTFSFWDGIIKEEDIEIYGRWFITCGYCTCVLAVSSGELEIILSVGLVGWRAGRGAGGSEEKLGLSSITVYLSLPVKCRTAAAAKSLQTCPTLCDPIDGSPQGSPIPGILKARTLQNKKWLPFHICAHSFCISYVINSKLRSSRGEDSGK